MKNMKKCVVLIVSILLVIILLVGVTYSIFTYTKKGDTGNTVKAGKITFLYTENTGTGAGINITNAFPVSDELGKEYLRDDQVFDFKIESEIVGNTSIPYEVNIEKTNDSTLEEEYIKIYLTDTTEDEEKELLSPIRYSELPTSSTKEDEKQIYFDEVKANENYLKNFRLRMWIADTDINGEEINIADISEKTFAIKVNVYSNASIKLKKAILKYNDNVIDTVLATNNKASFNIDDYNGTNISCNNGAIPNLESGILNVSNIKEDTVCHIFDSLATTINNLDDTENSIIMINDEEFNNVSINILNSKKVNLNLNGKIINDIHTKDETFILNKGSLTINDDRNNSGMMTTTYRLFTNSGKLIFNGGNFKRENNSNSAGAVVGIHGSGETIVNKGNFLGDKVWTIFAKDNSKLTINGGYIETLTNRAVNIYGNADLIVNGGQVVGKNGGSGIYKAVDATGLVTINEVDVKILGASGIAVANYSNSNININGGLFESVSKDETIGNHSTGIININDSKNRIYIKNNGTFIEEINNDRFIYYGLKNMGNGDINIISNKFADNCSMETENYQGICIASNYRTIVNERYCTGKVYIDNVYLYSNEFIPLANYDGILNIKNSTIVSNNQFLKEKYAIYNDTGTINICNCKVVGPKDFANYNSGVINYSNDVIFTNNTNIPTIFANTGIINANYSGTCTFN